MNPTAFPRQDARTIADDGDAFHFCSTCAFSDACLSQGMDKSSLKDLHVLVEQVAELAHGPAELDQVAGGEPGLLELAVQGVGVVAPVGGVGWRLRLEVHVRVGSQCFDGHQHGHRHGCGSAAIARLGMS